MLPTQKINTITIVFIAVTASLVAVTAIYRRQRCHTTAVNCSDSEEKPQSRFKRVFANNSYSPFKHFKRLGNEKEISLKAHPFEEEVRKLIENPPSLIEFVKSDRGLEMSDSYVWVETKDELELIVEALKKKRAFGVDTEQHSLRSFLGFTELMQTSTQKEDFLLDTIALHDEMGMLRDVFADPSICKSCMKVALDFVSPENVWECMRLTNEFRLLPQDHKCKQDKLEVKKIALHALIQVVNDIEGYLSNSLYEDTKEESAPVDGQLKPSRTRRSTRLKI